MNDSKVTPVEAQAVPDQPVATITKEQVLQHLDSTEHCHNIRLDTIRQYIEQARPTSPWLLIETAPKDGTHILACDAKSSFGWMDGKPLPPVQTTVHWWGYGDAGFYTSVNEREPQCPFGATHWKPLDGPNVLTRPTPAAADLHQQIMNLRCKMEPHARDSGSYEYAYAQGHRDARHAAAELVAASPAAAAPQPLQPPMRHIPGVRVELLARAGAAAAADPRPVAQMVALDDGLDTVILDFLGPRPPAGTFLYAVAAAEVPTDLVLVPREAPLALLQQLTGYDSVGWMEREHDRNTILERLRTRWAAILELVAASPAAAADEPLNVQPWPPGSSMLQVAVAPHAAAGPYPTAMRPATAEEAAAIASRLGGAAAAAGVPTRQPLTDAEIERLLDEAKVPEYPDCDRIDTLIVRVVEAAHGIGASPVAPVGAPTDELRKALELAVLQNELDMLMTGDELRQARALLSAQGCELATDATKQLREPVDEARRALGLKG